jgi:lipopolysaccharide export LptBFGC system permease protein LptF
MDEKKFNLSRIDDKEADGQNLRGVLVKSKGKSDVSLYFDSKTGLLCEMTYTKLQRDGTKEGFRDKFQKFKQVQGATVATIRRSESTETKYYSEEKSASIEYLPLTDAVLQNFSRP